MNICKVDGCNNEVVYKTKGLCIKCYKKEYRLNNREKEDRRHKEWAKK